MSSQFGIQLPGPLGTPPLVEVRGDRQSIEVRRSVEIRRKDKPWVARLVIGVGTSGER